MSAVRTLGWIAFLAASPMMWGQSIVSARAGLVHYSDGRVLLNEKQIVQKAAQFQSVNDQDYLRTEQGRAEVLLTPGVFLRLAESSQIQMLSTRLADVRLRLVEGSAVIEAADLNKDTAVTIETGQAQIKLDSRGLYHLTAGDESHLRVFQGEARVKAPGREYVVKGKREIELANDFQIQKFDADDTDTLDRWSKRRATYLSMANVSASRLAYSQGFNYSSSSWFYNPYYGMYTFLPMTGIAWSPYGYGYYSPRAVYAVYNPQSVRGVSPAGANGLSGVRSASQSGGSTSGVMSAGPRSAGGMSGGSGMSTGGGGMSGGGGGIRGGGGGGGISRGGARR